MDFKTTDFDDMTFNPVTVGRKKMTDVYPVLKRFVSDDMMLAFEKIGGIDKFLKMVSYMYDKGTPLRKITNYQARKREAMTLAGYKTDKRGDWSAEGKHVYEEKDPIIPRAIVLFVRQFHSHKYSAYVAFDRAFHRATEQLMSGSGTATGDKAAIDNMKTLEARLEAAEKELFMGKPSEVISKEVLMVMEEESLLIAPEDIAERLRMQEYIQP